MKWGSGGDGGERERERERFNQRRMESITSCDEDNKYWPNNTPKKRTGRLGLIERVSVWPVMKMLDWSRAQTTASSEFYFQNDSK